MAVDKVLDISAYKDYVLGNGLLMHKVSAKQAEIELHTQKRKELDTSAALAKFSALIELPQG